MKVNRIKKISGPFLKKYSLDHGEVTVPVKAMKIQRRRKPKGEINKNCKKKYIS